MGEGWGADCWDVETGGDGRWTKLAAEKGNKVASTYNDLETLKQGSKMGEEQDASLASLGVGANLLLCSFPHHLA